MSPANTPAWLPCRVLGSIPASSRASQETSSSSRCCGSIARASRGLIPKNSASKSAASRRKPAVRTQDGRGTQKTAGTCVRRTGLIGVRVKEPVNVPAPVVWESGNRFPAGGDQVPELLRRVRAAGEPTAHSHDDDRLLDAFLDLTQASASLAQVSGYQFQVIAKLILIRHLESPFLGEHRPRRPAGSSGNRRSS